MPEATNQTVLIADAKNRAARTFVQGLGIDVGIAVLFLLMDLFNNHDSWAQFDWKVISFALGKTVTAAIVSYTIRRFQRSGPLLPPEPQPEPAVPVTDFGNQGTPD